ncbi:MAG TPA: N-acetylmuramoyl-L-alanine amidase [Terriglobales bacterium]|nr:N-acetylmuramoyl-L-alanine amidase [Terriglobales bacterium]
MLESLTRQESLGALLAYSDLHERIRTRRAEGTASASDLDLFQTERFVLDEVLQLICDRALALTPADAFLIALEEGSSLLCRAAAGSLVGDRGTKLPADSEFLQDCLDSGRILRCDDCDVDARVDLDLSRQIEARATVLIPLRGRSARLGVLQAFSNIPYAFSDDDVRCFDLLGELVLSALRPEDQDRRLNWLSGVVDEVLVTKTAAVEPVADTKIANEITFSQPRPDARVSVANTEIARWNNRRAESEDFLTPELTPEASSSAAELLPAPMFLPNLATSRAPNPGLSVVLVLLAVAALFSGGVWFGMRNRDRQSANGLSVPPAAVPRAPAQVTTAPISDHLMDPMKVSTDTQALPSLSENKSAALFPRITGIRHWSTPMGSTVVIDMQDQAPYEVHRLMSPERIYFDLHDTALASGLDGKTIDVGDVSLTRVRVAQPVPGVTRVVLDTRDGSNFSVSMESNPNRMVVELRQTDRALAASRPSVTPHPVPSPKVLSSLSMKPEDEQLRAKTGKFRIALDAGHGGWDLGTVGRKGLLEKDLVLDVTRRLGKLLQARLGSEVIFTRTSDDYLPLDERANFANQAQVDLFVSVHANYSSSASARGVETYYTNSFVAPGSRELEKKESASIPPLTPVALSSGELHEKVDESRRLAASIQRSLYATLAANNSGIRDRGVKPSQFLVLTGTTMPAILTEISFVSSPADEHNLQSESYRQQIAEALYKGIARYQAASHHDKLADLRPTTARR